MADKNKDKNLKAGRRRSRVRGKIIGTTERPRLTVCRSLTSMTAQIIDDIKHVTLIGLSTRSKAIKDTLKGDNKTTQAGKLGEMIAQLAKEKGIESVVFDRNKAIYHGRVKAIAEGARKGGLKF